LVGAPPLPPLPVETSPIGVRPQAASANAAAIEKTAFMTLASLVIARSS
jgi:hypothetical protein